MGTNLDVKKDEQRRRTQGSEEPQLIVSPIPRPFTDRTAEARRDTALD